ncbi:MAG: YeeE/YedE family protein, partial [Alphaproteobacteria bacterium]|nr:YeeE/YedE family protein [Alphaproteobacteria bacterium]
SLGFVIVAAIGAMMVGVRLAKRNARPLFARKFHLPEFETIDRPLIVGGVLFGVGWGISGICPGPAITLIGFAPENLWIFLGTMFLGSFIGHYVLEALSAGKFRTA